MSRGTKDLIPRRQRVGDAAPITTRRRSSGSQPQEVELDVVDVRPSACSIIPPRAPSAAIGGGNHLDDVLVSQLKSVVHKQQRDLDDRTDNVNAIQRNFQRLSEMYSGDRERLLSTEARLSEAMKEIESLRANQRKYAALEQEYAALQVRFSERDEYTATASAELRTEYELLGERIAAMEAEKKALAKRVEEANKAAASAAGLQHDFLSSVESMELGVEETAQSVYQFQEAVDSMLTPLGERVMHRKRDTQPGGKTLEGTPAMRLSKCIQRLRFLQSTGIHPLHELVTSHLIEALETETRLRGDLEALQLRTDDERRKMEQKMAELEANYATVCSSFRQSSKLVGDEQQTMRQKLNSQAERLELTQQQLSVANEKNAKMAKMLLELEAAQEKTALNGETLEANFFLVLQWYHTTIRDQLELRAVLEKNSLASEAHQEARSLLTSLIHRSQTDAAVRAASSVGDRQKLHDLREQLLRVTEQNRATTAERDALKKELDEATKRYKHQEQQWSSEIVRLEGDLRRISTDHGEYDATLQGELKTLRQKKDEAERTAAFQREQDEAQIRGLQRDLEAAKNELRVTTDRCAQLERGGEEDRKSSAFEIDLARAEALQSRSNLEEAEAKGRAAQAEIKRLQQQLTTANDQLSAGKSDRAVIRELQGALAGMQRDTEDLRLQGASKSQTIKMLETKLVEAEAGKSDALRRAEEAALYSAKLLKQSEELAKQREVLEERSTAASLRAQQLRVLEEECNRTVKRILHAELACESGLSCQNCLQILHDPVLCVPCGHTFCKKCLAAANKSSQELSAPFSKKGKVLYCPECDTDSVSSVIPSPTLDLLSGKFSYRCQQLRDLSSLLERELSRKDGA